MTQLTKHFKLEEFTKSATAKRLGIDNTPSAEHIQNMKNLCEKALEPLREKFGPIIIGSGYRCEKLNKAIGGSKTSQHRIGEAADIHCPSNEIGNKYFEFLKKNVPYNQLIREYDNPRSKLFWIHIGLRRIGTNKMQVIECLYKNKT